MAAIILDFVERKVYTQDSPQEELAEQQASIAEAQQHQVVTGGTLSTP